MLRFEIKKIFSRNSNRIALLLLAGILGLTCYFAVSGVSYTNEQGQAEQGISAVRKLRAAKQEWTGPVTEETIAAAIEENARIIATEEYRSNDITQQNIAFGWGQGFYDIRTMINRSFCGFRDYDYYKIDSLTAADAVNFYGNRTKHLKEWLSSDEAKDQFSEAEKEYAIRQYETLKTPFLYEYGDGWNMLFEFSPTVIMVTMLILGFLVTGIFSSETSLKADAIFFSSYHGRGRAVAAKVKAGVIIVSAVYWAMLFLYTVIVLGFLGAGGAGLPIQATMSGWKSLYHLTNIQEYLLIVFGGYLGCLFLSLSTMFVAALSKNAVLAAMVPFAVIFLPSFLTVGASSLAGKIVGLLPVQLLQINEVTGLFQFYEIGGKVFHSLPLLFTVYSVLAVVMCPALYSTYKRTNIK